MKIKKTELPHYQLCHDMDVMVNKSVKLYDLCSQEADERDLTSPSR